MRLFATVVAMLSVATIIGVTSQPAHAAEAKSVSTKESKKVVKVVAGDSLSSIATSNKTTYQRLFFANKQIQHPDVIHPGQKLRVPAKNEKLKKRDLPGATVAAAPATYTAQANYASYQAPKTAPASKVSGGVWDKIAACESGGNWQINTGNGYYGGLQFSQGSWAAVGGKGSPSSASKQEQIKRGQMLQARQGWGAWPACSAKLGLR